HGGHASERPALAVSGAPLARGIPAQLLSRVRRARPGGDAAARSRGARRRYVAPHLSRGHAANPGAQARRAPRFAPDGGAGGRGQSGRAALADGRAAWVAGRALANGAGQLAPPDAGPSLAGVPGGGPTLAIQYVRSIPAFAVVKAAGGRPDVATSALSMLKLGDVPEPTLPASDWIRVMPNLAGICGSDLAAISGHISLYLDPLTSYPFVPGHEVVGVLDDGSRVVIEPALGCVVRGI